MKKTMKEILCSVVVRNAYPIIFATAIVALVSLFLIVDVRTGKPLVELDPSVDSILPVNSPDRQYFDQVKKVFDSGGTVIVALKDENDIFTTANLEKIKAISEEIEGLDKVNRVSSLSTALNIRSEGDDLLIQPFYSSPPQEQSDLDDLKSRALSDPIYGGNLISRDSKVTVIVVHLLDVAEKQLLDSKIDERIMAVTDKYWPASDTWITGGAHIKAQMSNVMLRDVKTVVPLAMLVMMLVCAFTYRSVRGVVIPMLVVGISVMVTMAFMAIFYKTLNQVSIAVPSVVIVVGYSYAIHVISGYYDALRLKLVPVGENPTLTMLKDVIMPVIYTGITTAVGFFSLATSSLSAIRQFGIGTGFGVCVTLLISLTLTPALLQLLALPKKLPEVSEVTWIDRCLEKLAIFAVKNAKPIYVASAIIAVVCLAAFPKINIGTDLINGFKESSNVRQDFNAVNAGLEGANTFEVVLETDVDAGFQEPDNLKVIEDLQSWFKQQPEIGGSTSIVDYIKTIYKGMTGDAKDFSIPADAMTVSQLVQIGGNEELADYANPDYQKARIIVRTTATNSSDVSALIDRTQHYLKEKIPSHIAARVTGNTYLVARTMDDIATGQVWNLVTAIVIIFFILSFVFSSFKYGFLAMLPNIMPVLIYFGILGYAEVSLNVTTALIACIVIGIAVDDTIHIFTQFNRLTKQTGNVHTGIVLAMKAVGRPVTYSTVALCGGFLCLVFSEMRTQVEFGLLAAITLFVGWLSDVTLTPAIAGRMKLSACGTRWH
jgi:predicted RND superfamily exporter protein